MLIQANHDTDYPLASGRELQRIVYLQKNDGKYAVQLLETLIES